MPNGHRRKSMSPKLEQLESREVPALSFLQGQVYNDANANGVRDAGEAVIPGTQVDLRNDAGNLIATTVSLDGTYHFDNLPAGTYRIVQTPPAGYANQAANIGRWDLGGATVLAPNTIQVVVSDTVHLDFEGRGNNTTLRMTLTNPLPTAISGISSSGRFFDPTGELLITLSGGAYASPTAITTYCLDLTNQLPAVGSAGTTVTPATTPPAPTLSANAGRIAYLYNTYGRSGFTSNPAASVLFTSAGLASGTPAEDASAFQLALWELCYDTGAGNLSTGNFFFRAVNGQPDGSTDPISTEIRAKANAFLQDSVGKSDLAVFLAGASAPAGQGTQTTIIGGSLDFGLLQASTISGTKYNDVNGDGDRDSGETGIAGWTIQLQQQVGSTWVDVTTAVTDSNGNYTFDGLPVGTFRVREVGQTGWLHTSADPSDTPTTAGSNSTGKDFGNFQLGSIGGLKFNDVNGDGDQDSGENGIAGWTIVLERQQTGDTWTPVTTAVTGAGGFYSFGDLKVGTYRVREVDQDGWMRTSANPPDVSVVSGTDSKANDFGNFHLTHLTGVKFNDLNGNGVQDAGDPVLAGWTIKLTNSDGSTQTAVTDGNGAYTFDGLAPGQYSVAEVQQGGWTATYGGSGYTITVGGDTGTPSGETATRNFGNFEQVTISGMKFEDKNGNGIQDSGENGLANWVIRLTTTNGVRTFTTGSDGAYSFDGLAPGAYTLQEDPQTGWLATYGVGGYQVTIGGTTGVTSGETATHDFGNFKLGSISGVKYNDVNGNGVRDASENGLSGWTIQLTNTASGITQTAVTDGNGAYSFGDLKAGTYQVREVGQDGWVRMSANPADVTVVSGTAESGKDFGNFKLVTVTGVKFKDVNGNGMRDDGEPGLADWVIRLTNPNGVRTFTTGASGAYVFDGLAPGTYTLQEDAQSGWVATYGIGGYQVTVGGPNGVVSGGSATSNFGNFQFGSISGMKYKDVNGNGTKDAGENGLSGWTIKLTNTTTGVTQSVVTDSDGKYAFGNLTAGTYQLREVGQTGWNQTSVNPTDVVVTSGTNSAGNVFGNFQLASISGLKFEDKNGNGVKDTGEDPLAGWVIRLTNTTTNEVRTFTTGTNGTYAFSGLVPGSYTLKEDAQSGWVATYGVGGYGITVGGAGVPSGGSVTSDFGNFQLVTISGLKFNDLNGDGVKQSSEPVLANFTFRLERLDGTTWTLVTTATSGTNGTFTFANVGPGTFRVREEVPTGWYQSTTNPAQFTATSRGTVPTQVFGDYKLGSVSGTKFLDQNGDGVWDPNGQSSCSSSDDERPLAGWTIFVDYNGNEELDAGEPFAVSGSDGKYTITGVKLGTWNVEEVTQLTWLRTSADRTVTITSGCAVSNVLFGNFRGDAVECGDTATIGFWHNCNGQSLINSLNGSANSVKLGNWLATEFPNLYGSLAGKKNSQVASYFDTLFQVQGMKLEAQILATALAVYVTDQQLAGGTYARRYGFNVDNVGTAGSLYNVKTNGAAFGVANNTTVNVWNLLKITDDHSSNGVAWVNSSTFRTMGNNVFSGINQAGDI